MQASIPSMRLPIQYALSYPDRLEREGTALAQPLRWSEIKQLDFDEADLERFPCLRLAYQAGRAGGSAPAALVGADETAVALFLSGAIHFTDIAIVVERTLERHNIIANPDVESVQAVSVWAQAEAARVAGELRGASVSLPHVDD
jgi:1-deoxy-D-xylulose-5-phosphate reductoisomerase